MAKKTKKNTEHTKDSNPNSVFFTSFIGEKVELICKGPSATTEIGVFPIVVNGYLLDLDDDHLYLSDDGQNIARAVKRAEYITIEIVKNLTKYDEALETVLIPEESEDGN